MMESPMTRNCHVGFGERYEETHQSEDWEVRFVPTPLSPLLANIALHGIQRMLEEYAETLNMREDKYPHRTLSKARKIQTLAFLRYADDFVVIHKSLEVIQKCRELISQWLKDIGLELKPSKTRIAHTLIPEQSEDGKVGFDFLGYYIRQYPTGRYKSAKNGASQTLGFQTLITPSKQSLVKHQESIKKTIDKHKYASQIDLINDLNPIIRGWCNYYSFSDANTTREFSRQDNLVYQKLRAWGKHRCKGLKTAHKKYFHKIGNRNWVFAVREGNANPFRLLLHGSFESSSTNYVKVKGDKSPYDEPIPLTRVFEAKYE